MTKDMPNGGLLTWTSVNSNNMLYYIRYIRIRLDVFSQKKKEKKKN